MPVTGTYTVRVTVAPGYASTLSLTLSGEVTGTLPPNTTPTTFSTARVGQNARYTFSGTIGQNVSVAWSGSTITAGQVYVYQPDGLQLSTASFGADGYISLTSLLETGTYTVWVVPNGVYTGQVAMHLLTDATGPISTNGAPLDVSLLGFQNGSFTFVANAGQELTLTVDNLLTVPASQPVGISVLAPDGVTTIATCGVAGPCALPVLTVTGTYTVRVFDSANFTTTLTLSLQ